MFIACVYRALVNQEVLLFDRLVMRCGWSSIPEVVDVGREQLELHSINIGLILHSLAVPFARGRVGRNSAGSFKRIQVMLEAGPSQLLVAVQDDSLQDLAGGTRALLMQVTQDGRVGSVPENFDGCLNLLRVIGLYEARHASILPDYLNGPEFQQRVYR
jgi:hypothetical protein